MQRLLTGVNRPLPYLFPCQSTKIQCPVAGSFLLAVFVISMPTGEHGLGEGDASLSSLVVSLEVNAFASAD